MTMLRKRAPSPSPDFLAPTSDLLLPSYSDRDAFVRYQCSHQAASINPSSPFPASKRPRLSRAGPSAAVTAPVFAIADDPILGGGITSPTDSSITEASVYTAVTSPPPASPPALFPPGSPPQAPATLPLPPAQSSPQPPHMAARKRVLPQWDPCDDSRLANSVPSAGLAAGETVASAGAWSAARSDAPARKRYRLADPPSGVFPPDRPPSPSLLAQHLAATPLIFDADAEDALGCVDPDPAARPPPPPPPSTPVTSSAQPACLVRLPAPALRSHCLPLPLSHRLLTWSGPAPSPRQELAPYWLDPSAPSWTPPTPSPLSNMVPTLLAPADPDVDGDATVFSVRPIRNRLALPPPTSTAPSDLQFADAAAGPRIVEILDDSVDPGMAFSPASLAAPPEPAAPSSPLPSLLPSSASSWPSSLFDSAPPAPASWILPSTVSSATAWWGALTASRDGDCMDVDE